MCGLENFLAERELHPEPKVAQRELTFTRRRRPDVEGTWSGAEATVRHGRLSGTDLNPRAAPPTISRSDLYVAIFNGECFSCCRRRDGHMEQRIPLRTTPGTEHLLDMFARSRERRLDGWLFPGRPMVLAPVEAHPQKTLTAEAPDRLLQYELISRPTTGSGTPDRRSMRKWEPQLESQSQARAMRVASAMRGAVA